jgi:hypothetical protein
MTDTDTPASTNFCSLTPAIAAEALQDLGYRGKIEIKDGWAYVYSAALGADFRVTLYSAGPTDRDTPCRSCQFRTGFRLSSRTDMTVLGERCREYNEAKRFGKAYSYWFHGELFVAMEMDVITTNSDARGLLSEAAGPFIGGMASFLRDVLEDLPEPTAGSIDKLNRSIGLVRGSPEQLAEGVALLAEASADGFAGAQNNYGDYFERGRGVPKSELFAIYWYTRAAERGEPTAYLSLASLLSENGAGPVMLLEAQKFALLAFHFLPEGTNRETAKYLIGSIGEAMTEEQRDAAFEAAKAWRPLYQETVCLSDTPDALGPIAEASGNLN